MPRKDSPSLCASPLFPHLASALSFPAPAQGHFQGIANSWFLPSALLLSSWHLSHPHITQFLVPVAHSLTQLVPDSLSHFYFSYLQKSTLKIAENSE